MSNTLTLTVGKFNIYAVYSINGSYSVCNNPMFISKSKSEYFCQIIRDIDFSFILNDETELNLYFIKIDTTEKLTNQTKKMIILKYVMFNKFTNICKTLLTHKISKNMINKNDLKLHTYYFNRKIFDKIIIYKALEKYLPIDLIDKIAKYIDDTIYSNLSVFKSKNNSNDIYCCNPFLTLPNSINCKLLSC